MSLPTKITTASILIGQPSPYYPMRLFEHGVPQNPWFTLISPIPIVPMLEYLAFLKKPNSLYSWVKSDGHVPFLPVKSSWLHHFLWENSHAEVSNVSFLDYDLDLGELGGPISWDGSDVAEPWQRRCPKSNHPFLMRCFLGYSIIIIQLGVPPID